MSGVILLLLVHASMAWTVGVLGLLTYGVRRFPQFVPADATLMTIATNTVCLMTHIFADNASVRRFIDNRVAERCGAQRASLRPACRRGRPPSVATDFSGGFSRSFKATAGVMPEIWLWLFLPHFFPLWSSVMPCRSTVYSLGRCGVLKSVVNKHSFADKIV